MGSAPSGVRGGAAPGATAAVVAVCLAMMVAGINTTAVGVATRGIADELGVSLRVLEWVMSAYLVGAAAFALLGGRLGDVIGRERTLVLGCLVFMGGCLVAALAPGPAVLIAARAVQGVGAALVMPASIEVIAAHPPVSGPSAGFRVRGVVFASAFGIGPLLGGILTDNLSWRAVFWFELVVLAAAVAVAAPLLRQASGLPRPPTRDFLGASLAAVVVFLVVFMLSRAPAWGWMSWPTGALLAVAVLLGGWLLRVEGRAEHPMIHPGLLRDRVVVGANVAILGASIGMVGLIYFFGVFAQSALVFDSTALAVAFALVPFTVAIVVFSVVAGFLSRRLGFRGPVLVGLGSCAAGFAWLGTVTVTTTEAQLVAPLAICGIGAGIANAGLTSPAVLTERQRLDEAAGLVSLTRFVGAAIAIALGTATYLSVAIGPAVPAAVVEGDPAAITLGGSAYRRAVAAMRQDLRRPFDAAANTATVDAFGTTMRWAAAVLALLTVLSAVLLASARRSGDAPA